MAKKGKRGGMIHTRVVKRTGPKAFSYTERRGIRELTISVGDADQSDASSLSDSEHPTDKAKFLAAAATRLLTMAGEKSLSTVMKEARAGTPNDQDNAIQSAVRGWIDGLIQKYGALSPATLAAQFLAHQYTIVKKLSQHVEGVASNAIDEEAKEKFTKEMSELFPVIYALCDAWHWWRMELHGDHERLIDASETAASRQKGSAANRAKKERRDAIVREAFKAYRESGGRSISAKKVVGEIKEAVMARWGSESDERFISDDRLTRLVRKLISNSVGDL
jgi:hypothetical protein